MWLINVKTYKLEHRDKCPKRRYAILSHTWGKEEVTFQDFKDRLKVAKKQKGYAKIEQTIIRARKAGLKWAWVDTCCIDKSSSAECTEAINSMFQWYKNSAICYAYLSDFSKKSADSDLSFQKSRWWTRGWTLQELIAPREVRFYDRDWTFYESRTILATQIEFFTGIDRRVYQEQPDFFSIAQRMSWAAKRETTKEEDIAYCLLGLFGVHMPLIYGEGKKAFVRLQEEICKTTTDFTLLAWKADDAANSGGANQDFRGLLAQQPSEFSESHKVHRELEGGAIRMFIMSQELYLEGTRLFSSPEDGYWLRIGANGYGTGAGFIWIALTKTQKGYARSQPDLIRQTEAQIEDEIGGSHRRLEATQSIPGTETIRCLRYLTRDESSKHKRAIADSLLLDIGHGVEIITAYPPVCWDARTGIFLPGEYTIGAFDVAVNNGHNSAPFLLLCQWPTSSSTEGMIGTRRWEHMEYTFLHKTAEVDSFFQSIVNGEMIAKDIEQSVRLTMGAEFCAGWNTSTRESRDLSCENDIQCLGLRGELTRDDLRGRLSLKLQLVPLFPNLSSW